MFYRRHHGLLVRPHLRHRGDHRYVRGQGRDFTPGGGGGALGNALVDRHGLGRRWRGDEASSRALWPGTSRRLDGTERWWRWGWLAHLGPFAHRPGSREGWNVHDGDGHELGSSRRTTPLRRQLHLEVVWKPLLRRRAPDIKQEDDQPLNNNRTQSQCQQ